MGEGRGSQAEPGPAIRLAGLWREFGDRVALQDVSVELALGESLVVIGPNGSGKTTLLRVLATLLRPSGGDVFVLGARLPREAWRVRGRIGYVGHEPLLYRDLTVRENLTFHATLHGLEAPDGRIAELLERVGMSRRAEELTRNLSAGMAQRVAVCRAVLHDPELLLLDEPGAHLDPEASELIEPLIGAGEGRTRVAVTHDFRAGLASGGDALALGHGGSVAYCGPAAGLSEPDAEAIYRGALR
ncbi:MAG: ABC transporter ATP-binding protein [Solirubrobacterales bacterium]